MASSSTGPPSANSASKSTTGSNTSGVDITAISVSYVAATPSSKIPLLIAPLSSRFKKSAKQSAAMNNLGAAYERGIGGKARNDAEALSWFSERFNLERNELFS